MKSQLRWEFIASGETTIKNLVKIRISFLPDLVQIRFRLDVGFLALKSVVTLPN